MDTIPWSCRLVHVAPALQAVHARSRVAIRGRAQARSVVATAKTPARFLLHRKPLAHLLVRQGGAFATTRIFSITQGTIGFIADRSRKPSVQALTKNR